MNADAERIPGLQFACMWMKLQTVGYCVSSFSSQVCQEANCNCRRTYMVAVKMLQLPGWNSVAWT